MIIGIFCRNNDNNLSKFISELSVYDLDNIFVLIETKTFTKNHRINNWIKDNIDLSIDELFFLFVKSSINYFFRKNVRNKKNSFDAESWCKKNKLNYIHEPHNSTKTKEYIINKNIKNIYLLSGGIIKKNITSINNLKIFNGHPGKLPEHRGLGSFEWSILEDSVLATTYHIIDDGIDSGDILKIVQYKPQEFETVSSIKNRMENEKPYHFAQIARDIKNNKVTFIKQNIKFGVLHRRLTRTEKKLVQEKFLDRLNSEKSTYDS